MEKYKMYAVLSCLCVAFETLFELIIPMIMADIIDVGVANGDQAYILERACWFQNQRILRHWPLISGRAYSIHLSFWQRLPCRIILS